MSGRRKYSQEIITVCRHLCLSRLPDQARSVLADADLVGAADHGGISRGGMVRFPVVERPSWRVVGEQS